MSEPNVPFQILIVWEDTAKNIVDFLRDRGLGLFPIPSEEDDIPTYGITSVGTR
jgi:hypothetical protein